MPDLEIAMLESFFDCDSLGRVEGEHFFKEVESVWVCLWEEADEGDGWHVWEVTDIFLSTWGADSAEGFFVGCSEVVQDLIELVDVVAALEEGTATEEFGEDTAHGPDVDCENKNILVLKYFPTIIYEYS